MVELYRTNYNAYIECYNGHQLVDDAIVEAGDDFCQDLLDKLHIAIMAGDYKSAEKICNLI